MTNLILRAEKLVSPIMRLVPGLVSRGGVLLMALFVAMSTVTPASAQKGYGTAVSQSPSASFDHDKTGFPLTGGHRQAACETCHVAGRFVDTPRQCNGCHNGAIASGMSVSHPRSTQQCDSCHTTGRWGAIRAVDHTQTAASCVSCHNGVTATGRAAHHIPTTADCQSCHKSYSDFGMAATMDHSVVSEARCDSCHNGSYTTEGSRGALGKSAYPGHVTTSQDCSTCHRAAVASHTSWAGVTSYDHQASDTACSSCHNGTSATGMAMPPHIPVTGVQCSSCHVNTAANFSAYTMGVSGHAAVSASRCDSCHNGSYTSQGTKGAQASSSYNGHVATGGQDCATCHTSAATNFSSWAGVSAYNHLEADTACSTCHNGVAATGMTMPPHIPVPGIQCSNCHSNSASSFTTYTMGPSGHAAVAAMRCDTCHNGNYVSQGIRGAQGTGASAGGTSSRGAQTNASYVGHVNTGGQDCRTCHTRAASNFDTWAGVTAYNHLPGNTNCSTCHNGVAATGMKMPPHIPVAGVQCSACHSNTAGTFTVYTMGTTGHAAVASQRCDTCHNGGYTGQGAKGAQGSTSYAGHVATKGQDCSTCHTAAASSFTSWAGVTAYTHQASDTNCSTCHNGTAATGMSMPPHIPVVGVQCSACHSNTAASFSAGYAMNHAAVTASRCDSCHNGSYTGEGAKGAIAKTSYPGHVATNGQDCSTCHTAAAASHTTWAGVTAYAHQASDTNCSTCHNGTAATGMATPPHIPVTGVQCSSCHSNTAGTFTVYTMNHTSVVANRCDGCHNGSYTSQGSKGALGTSSYASHFPTGGRDCGTCHVSSAVNHTSWAGGRYVHVTSDFSNCTSCHNGATAKGQPATHIPVTGVDCYKCHVSTAASFKSYSAGSALHSAVTGKRCDSCHNGAYISQGIKGAYGVANYPGHIPTSGADCSTTCHKSSATVTNFTSWATATGKTYTHLTTDTTCTNCHNGTTATGKGAAHIPTGSAQCSSCHPVKTTGTRRNTSFSVYSMTTTGHAAVVGSMRCDACHNGSYTTQGTKGAYSTASYPGHKATNGADCATTCHTTSKTAYTSWTGAKNYTHVAADTNCMNCHNGTTATGPSATRHIPVAGVQCTPCHVNTSASFVTYTMGTTGHAAVAGKRCDSCHNGSYVSQGTTGAYGTSTWPGHRATNGADCTTCHTSSVTSWANAKNYTHVATDTNCRGCHDGVKAQGMSTPPHIPIGGAQCSGCHSMTAASFSTYTMGTTGHAAVTTRCDSCHNGQYVKNKTYTGTTGAQAKKSDHPATVHDCGCCHTSRTSWGGRTSTKCSATDTTTTTGRSVTAARSATMIPVTNTMVLPLGHQPTREVCTSCHAQAQVRSAAAAHTAMTAPCATCHNGTTALGKPARHVVTTAACDTCHKNTTTFVLAKFVHTPGSAACATCHDGKAAVGKPARHVVTTATCDTCHKSIRTFAGARFTHTGTTAACSTCHDGKTSSGKPANHVATTAPCDTCHKSTRMFGGARFAHLTTTAPCATCHDGVKAIGKLAKHLPTTEPCETCHKSTHSFAIARMEHKGPMSACATCHDGVKAIGKLPGHIATTAACDTCHKGTRSFAFARFDHTTATGPCAGCHDGHKAIGKPANHAVTTAACDDCHKGTRSFGLGLTPATPAGTGQARGMRR